MKVKVTHEDKILMLEIPATKVLVVIDKKRELERNGRDQDNSEALYLLESNDPEETMELTTDEEAGALALFYNPVLVIDKVNIETHDEEEPMIPSHVYATGWTTFVYLVDTPADRRRPEAQYTRTENGFTIITTPRVLVDAMSLTAGMRENPQRANVRYRSDLGNYTSVVNTRVSDAFREELAEFLRAPRDHTKNYAEHSLIDKDVEVLAIEAAKKEEVFSDSPFAANDDYWQQIAMNYAIH